VRTAVVVKFEPAGDPGASLTGAGVVAQVNLLDLQTAPQPLDEDVVQRPAPPVAADLDAGRQQTLLKSTPVNWAQQVGILGVLLAGAAQGGLGIESPPAPAAASGGAPTGAGR
jgi:hypothetical protein